MDTSAIQIIADGRTTHVFNVASSSLQDCLSEFKQVGSKYKTPSDQTRDILSNTADFVELLNEVNPPSDIESEAKTTKENTTTTTTTSTITTYDTNTTNSSLPHQITKQTSALNLNSWNGIPSTIQAFIKKPFKNTIYEENMAKQISYWNDFCASNHGKEKAGKKYYKCTKINYKKFSDNDTDNDLTNFVNNYDALWECYCKFRLNFIESKLFEALNFSKLNSLNPIISKLISFNMKRNQICFLLANNNDIFGNFELFEQLIDNLISIIAKRDKNNKNSNYYRVLLDYILIYNGINEILSNFDQFWQLEMSALDDGSIVDELKEYLLKIFLDTSLFGLFGSKMSGNLDNNYRNNDVAGQEAIEKAVFANLLQSKEVTQLIEYCTQDISSELITFYRNNRKINPQEQGTQTGLKYFIINRWAYAMCFNEKELGPLLKQVFSTLEIVSIYNGCYVKDNGKNSESFFISLLMNLSKFGMIGKNNESLSDLRNVILFNSNMEGTLLHSSTSWDMYYYTKLLTNKHLPFQFDCYKKNRRETNKDCNSISSIKPQSAYDIALEQNYPTILKLFSSTMTQNDDKTNENSWKNSSVSAGQVEHNYRELLKQISFSRHFLLNLGCIFYKRPFGISHKLLSFESEEGERKWYQDVLYHDFSELGGNNIRSNLKEDNSINYNAESTMIKVVNNVIELISNRMPLSDDLLMLSIVFLNECILSSYNEKENDKKLIVKFLETLKKCSMECLNEKFISSETKARDSAWFKMYLLNTNVWLYPLNEMNKKIVAQSSLMKQENNELESKMDDSDESGNSNIEISILYDLIANIAQKTLTLQKQFIWTNVENERNNDNENWSQLTNLSIVDIIGSAGDSLNDNNYEWRQDKIVNGILPDVSEFELYIMAPKVDQSNNFDPFNEANTNTYLSKLLIFAHSMNETFMNDTKILFTNNLKFEKNINCTFQPAPVKLTERCVIKAQTDYGDKAFPSVANILDFVRCSVTFNTSKDLMDGLAFFGNKVSSSEAGCILKILRVKNGFSRCKNWTSFSDCHYCDVKVNIIVYDNNTNQALIGEIQFLLKWLLIAKKKGHKLYSIERRKDFINHVSSSMSEDYSYNRYNSKINELIQSSNLNYLTSELIWQPNLVFSTIHFEGEPYLYHIGNGNDDDIDIKTIQKQSMKMFDMFLACLYHYTNKYFDSNSNSTMENEDPFMSRYLNYHNCDSLYCYGDRLWGIDVIKMKKDSSKYKMVKYILNSKYFNGLSHKNFIIKAKEKETVSVKHESIIRDCCAFDNFEYLSLIFSNSIKNSYVIQSGINLCNNGGFDSPLNVLIQSQHCNTIWLEMFFNGIYKYALNCTNLQNENISKCYIQDKYLDTAIANIDGLNINRRSSKRTDKDISNWKDIINKYRNKCVQFKTEIEKNKEKEEKEKEKAEKEAIEIRKRLEEEERKKREEAEKDMHEKLHEEAKARKIKAERERQEREEREKKEKEKQRLKREEEITISKRKRDRRKREENDPKTLEEKEYLRKMWPDVLDVSDHDSDNDSDSSSSLSSSADGAAVLSIEERLKHFKKIGATGQLFLKFTGKRRRKPQDRIIKISFDDKGNGKQISWGSGSRHIDFNDILYCVCGHYTPVFLARQDQLDPQLCISIVGKNQILDIQAQNKDMAQLWSRGIRQLLNQTEEDALKLAKENVNTDSINRSIKDDRKRPDADARGRSDERKEDNINIDDSELTESEKEAKSAESLLVLQQDLYVMTHQTVVRNLKEEGWDVSKETQEKLNSKVMYERTLKENVEWRRWNVWTRNVIVKYLKENGQDKPSFGGVSRQNDSFSQMVNINSTKNKAKNAISQNTDPNNPEECIVM